MFLFKWFNHNYRHYFMRTTQLCDETGLSLTRLREKRNDYWFLSEEC